MTEQQKPPADAGARAAAYEKETQEAKEYLDRLHGDGVSDVHPYKVERRWEKPEVFKPGEHSSEFFVPRKRPLWPSLLRWALILVLLGLAARVAWNALTVS
jgi:hypothetical protein